MKILYDMSTGQILETPGKKRRQTPFKIHYTEPSTALRLQEITPDQSTTVQFPDDLSLADLDSFLTEMG